MNHKRRLTNSGRLLGQREGEREREPQDVSGVPPLLLPLLYSPSLDQQWLNWRLVSESSCLGGRKENVCASRSASLVDYYRMADTNQAGLVFLKDQ